MKGLNKEKYIEVKQDENVIEKSNLKGDRRNFAFLILLYVLQGVPQGISVAIPILLQNRGVSYNDQAEFSISYFPFSMKLLWAPIVDSVYLKSFGRRKTWICGSQIFVGIFMIYTSLCVDEWMGIEGNKPQILMLTIIFFILWFLTSCQDIAVDGYGLTLLQRKNIGYAATANSVGQQAGKFIGFIIFLVFESKDFCNSYIFSEPRNQGLFTLSGFLMFWAIIYLLITILIAIFKSEKCETSQELHETTDYGIKRAYPILVDIIKLKPVIQLCTMIFTIEACFAAIDAVSSLKLIEYGVPKDKFALLSIPSAPVQILFPLFITKFTTGRKPLSFYFKLFPCRVITMILITFFVYNTRAMLASDNSILYFYVGIIILFLFDQCLTRATYAADGSFFSKIADPLVGGTYMTLMNTFGNLGKRVSVTFFLWLVDKITWKQCSSSANTFSVQNSTTINTCANILEKEACIENGGNCETIVDGFYIEIAISVIIALIWYKFMKSVIFQLQRYPREDWFVLTGKSFKTDCDMKAVKIEKK